MFFSLSTTYVSFFLAAENHSIRLTIHISDNSKFVCNLLDISIIHSSLHTTSSSPLIRSNVLYFVHFVHNGKADFVSQVKDKILNLK